jgi:hypothetical protein
LYGLDEDVSSLSAIFLNDDYYRFIHDGKKMAAGLPVAGPQKAPTPMRFSVVLKGPLQKSD